MKFTHNYNCEIIKQANFRPGWFELRLTSGSSNILTCTINFADGILPSNIELEDLGNGELGSLVYLRHDPQTVALTVKEYNDLSGPKVALKKCHKWKFWQKLAVKAIRAFCDDPIKNTPHLLKSLSSLFTKSYHRQIRTQYTKNSDAYSKWMQKYDYSEEQSHRLKEQVDTCELQPKIELLIPVHNIEIDVFRATVDSIKSQIYTHWNACIAVDGGTSITTIFDIKKLISDDPRFKLTVNQKNLGISETTNAAYALSDGEWIGLLDHDDLLREHALAEMILKINEKPTSNLIYSDEDKVDTTGNRFNPHFKCDFSPELILAMNYFNHFTMLRSSLVKQAGLWRKEYDGAQDYDLFLRIIALSNAQQIQHIPKVLYHWRASKFSEANSNGTKPYAKKARLRAVEDYLNKQKHEFSINLNPLTGYNDVHFQLTETPNITIIIPTRDKKKLLEKCISSIVSKTTYKNYNILVIDNGSKEADAIEYLNTINQNPQIRVIQYDKPFNYSQINNFAVRQTDDDIICFLNNDIEVISENWLENMLSWLQRPGVGVVGAKLLYANDTIQHAGVILGVGGVAGHAHKYYKNNALGYYARLTAVQNFSAVTGACMIMRKEDFLKVDGFDENKFPISYNDIDLCLKIRETDQRIIWTPQAEFIHHESASRGLITDDTKYKKWSKEAIAFQEKWGELIYNDPYYSPNLSRVKEDFSYRT